MQLLSRWSRESVTPGKWAARTRLWTPVPVWSVQFKFMQLFTNSGSGVCYRGCGSEPQFISRSVMPSPHP